MKEVQWERQKKTRPDPVRHTAGQFRGSIRSEWWLVGSWVRSRTVAWRGPGELLISAASTAAAAVVVAGDVEKDLKHNPRRFVNCGK